MGVKLQFRIVIDMIVIIILMVIFPWVRVWVLVLFGGVGGSWG